MRVIGIKRCDFPAPDGNRIQGYQLFCVSDPIDGRIGAGYECEKFFLSDQKIARGSIVPKCDDVIKVIYNKYGKVDSVEVIS